jgi:hypothetical protein
MSKNSGLIIKKCHVCGQIVESSNEVKRCPSCKKSFLPSNYFARVHESESEGFQELFQDSTELDEYYIIKGIQVIW